MLGNILLDGRTITYTDRRDRFSDAAMIGLPAFFIAI
jgi:hypothetical protein